MIITISSKPFIARTPFSTLKSNTFTDSPGREVTHGFNPTSTPTYQPSHTFNRKCSKSKTTPELTPTNLAKNTVSTVKADTTEPTMGSLPEK